MQLNAFVSEMAFKVSHVIEGINCIQLTFLDNVMASEGEDLQRTGHVQGVKAWEKTEQDCRAVSDLLIACNDNRDTPLTTSVLSSPSSGMIALIFGNP